MKSTPIKSSEKILIITNAFNLFPDKIAELIESIMSTHKPKAVRISEILSRAQNCRRRVFSVKEDRAIIKIVNSTKFNNNWESVAKAIPWRTPRQCRDRWTYYLSPANNFSPFSVDEDKMIIEKVNEYGTKWATIAKTMTGRSDNSIKNRWYSKLKSRCLVDDNGVYSLDLSKYTNDSEGVKDQKNDMNSTQKIDLSTEILNDINSEDINSLSLENEVKPKTPINHQLNENEVEKGQTNMDAHEINTDDHNNKNRPKPKNDFENSLFDWSYNLLNISFESELQFFR
ncbi:Myb-like DNA-binding domain containing protein [Tritrichomonas foetus]|uniref:Myb-like DNA-binding domain containing protein n=1 Tax=Tritrichomonas foetus TaxID=1144522 RepID=A0A1J4JTE7_9EUKA|nr:Myb-like DNA-binding domain containing protein [Tritrichomonas foetus]|eukprot:OHT00772.1 Myb-like DNA-binding domain containing protein [Tritrichomonas foetus]